MDHVAGAFDLLVFAAAEEGDAAGDLFGFGGGVLFVDAAAAAPELVGQGGGQDEREGT